MMHTLTTTQDADRVRLDCSCGRWTRDAVKLDHLLDQTRAWIKHREHAESPEVLLAELRRENEDLRKQLGAVQRDLNDTLNACQTTFRRCVVCGHLREPGIVCLNCGEGRS